MLNSEFCLESWKRGTPLKNLHLVKFCHNNWNISENDLNYK